MSLDTADDIELSLQESVSSFNRYHGLALPNSDDLTSKTPSGYFTRDGGYIRVSDNPHYDNEYDVDKIIQSHEKLNSFRLRHHLFMRKSVEAYRSLYMDIAPSTTLSTDVPSGLIKQVEAMPYRRKVPSQGLVLK